jgi:outer membrane protein OmpA-like peptidoglycan-associated protein
MESQSLGHNANMRRLLVLFLALVAAPLCAQASAPAAGVTRALNPEIRELSTGTRDLDASVRDLDPAVRDLVPVVQEMIRVTTAAREVKIELPADVLFDFDKAEIRPDAAVALGAAAELLRKGVNGAVKIDGHTDSKGAAAYNLKLSQDRARSVQAWFTKNGGLPANLRYTLTGYGLTRPKVPNAKPDGSDDPAGRQTNRRVEITFTPR